MRICGLIFQCFPMPPKTYVRSTEILIFDLTARVTVAQSCSLLTCTQVSVYCVGFQACNIRSLLKYIDMSSMGEWVYDSQRSGALTSLGCNCKYNDIWQWMMFDDEGKPDQLSCLKPIIITVDVNDLYFFSHGPNDMSFYILYNQ